MFVEFIGGCLVVGIPLIGVPLLLIFGLWLGRKIVTAVLKLHGKKIIVIELEYYKEILRIQREYKESKVN